jgi:hypothetical protein
VPQNRVQYQEGLSLSDFIQAYGTEEKCLWGVVAACRSYSPETGQTIRKHEAPT